MFFTRIHTSPKTVGLCDNIFASEAFCTLAGSWYETYQMFLGVDYEISDRFEKSNRFLLSIVSFLVAILLLNILIAIVNASFLLVAQGGRKLFWRMRLEFVTQTESTIRYLCCDSYNRRGVTRHKNYLKNIKTEMDRELDEMEYLHRSKRGTIKEVDSARLLWDVLMVSLVRNRSRRDLEETELFLAKMNDGKYMNLLKSGLIYRQLTSLIVVLPWFIVGFLSAGIFWPPQMREFLFCPHLDEVDHKHSDPKIKDVIRENDDNRLQTMGKEVDEMKMEIQSMRKDIVNEMNSIKELLLTLKMKE